MARARRIILKTRTFEKVGDATLFFRDMLHRYSIGETVSESDALDLHAVLERHEERAEKVGCGISHFVVSLPPDHDGRCFWIVRSDGIHEDFSVKHCLSPRHYD